MKNYNPASGNSPALSIDQAEQMNRLLWRVLDLTKVGAVVAERLHHQSLDADLIEEGNREWQGLFGLLETIELLAEQCNEIAVQGMNGAANGPR